MENQIDNTVETKNDRKIVTYVYATAFTTCDCGQEIVLSQKIYGNPTYSGECDCGKTMKLRHGKFSQQ